MPRIATIGVYGFSGQEFLSRLLEAEVSQLLDVRQRRGVRGAEYAWANAQRLQAALAETGIAYRHHPELAPTTELRQLQYAVDAERGVGKRSRDVLAPAYVKRYEREILGPADLGPLVADLPERGIAALFCVEADPEACHRSLIADRLAAEFGAKVTHLRPAT
ncbi:MAG: hypothetical protein JWM73_358 [Solirubrobacterales bacterium]|nr:hypothetical protein [Solirubrobacterales bacterium]